MSNKKEGGGAGSRSSGGSSEKSGSCTMGREEDVEGNPQTEKKGRPHMRIFHAHSLRRMNEKKSVRPPTRASGTAVTGSHPSPASLFRSIRADPGILPCLVRRSADFTSYCRYSHLIQIYISQYDGIEIPAAGNHASPGMSGLTRVQIRKKASSQFHMGGMKLPVFQRYPDLVSDPPSGHPVLNCPR